MTTDKLDPATTSYTISGTGPYAVDHGYGAAGDFVISVIDADDGATVLDEADWSISPAGPTTGGDLTLSAGAASTHDGLTLMITRVTEIEQGWAAATPREVGFEAQQDRTVMALQEVQRDVARAMRVRSGTVAPYTPADGRAPMWDDAKGGFINGPTADEVASAQSYAEAADAARALAVIAQGAAETAEAGSLSALDSFTDQYLGVKTSDPATDNDGNPLVEGATYFNSATTEWKIRVGGLWLVGLATGSGSLVAANNLADVVSVATSRTNLGLDTMALQAANAVAITGGTVAGVAQTGGAIDGTPIGGTTAAAGDFTDLTAAAATLIDLIVSGSLTGVPGRLLGTRVIDTAGTTTYIPRPGTKYALVQGVEATGGGGGADSDVTQTGPMAGDAGAGSGAPGGSGFIGLADVSQVGYYADVVTGAAGAGVSQADGSAGGASSWDDDTNTITMAGGLGGLSMLESTSFGGKGGPRGNTPTFTGWTLPMPVPMMAMAGNTSTTGWSAASVTAAASATPAPDGSTGTVLVTSTGSDGRWQRYTTDANHTVTFSAWVKPAAGTEGVSIGWHNGGGGNLVYARFAGGEMGQTNADGTATEAGEGGWYLVSVTSPCVDAVGYFFVAPWNGVSGPNFGSRDSGDAVEVWGATITRHLDVSTAIVVPGADGGNSFVAPRDATGGSSVSIAGDGGPSPFYGGGRRGALVGSISNGEVGADARVAGEGGPGGATLGQTGPVRGGNGYAGKWLIWEFSA